MTSKPGNNFGFPGLIALVALIIAIGGAYAAADDDEGSSGTAEGTLSEGTTQVGGWAFNATKAEKGETVYVAISFPTKLAEWLKADKVHFASDKGFSGVCQGKVEEPVAPSGHLCVYSNVEFGGLQNATLDLITSLGLSSLKEANSSGAILKFSLTGQPAYGYGSWAVTG